MDPFLRATPVLDHDAAPVRALAAELAAGSPVETARRAFEWVRDRIAHIDDRPADVVACSASEVLAAGVAFCYPKCHLLAALLRANGIPAGLAYQRLPDGGRFVLHGLVACGLSAGWYLCDPRGNRPGVDAQFTPPVERLVHVGPEVSRVPGVFPDPLPSVVEALRGQRTYAGMCAHLPDWAG